MRGYTILIAVPCGTGGTATEPPPPPPPPSDCATLADVTAARDAVIAALPAVSPSTILAAIAASQATILTTMAADKGAVLAALAAAKAEILTAISVPPSGSSGYAKVGGTQFAKLKDAAAAVPAGGVVEVYGELRDLDATAGFPLSCTVRGMTPDAKLNWTLGTTQSMALGKGLVVCSGAGQSYVVENLELTGARVTSANGAGVRGDGAAQVTVQNCNIHDCENGVLSIANVLALYANTFKNNGNAAGNGHGVYVNDTTVAEVTAEDNVFYAAINGNQFKSRAKKTTFRRNLVAELDGTCSWQVDLSNGGDCLIEKNVIEQGPNASNRNLVSYGPEGVPADGRVNALAFRDNVVINDHALDAWGLNIFNVPTSLEIARNTFVGPFAAHVVGATPDGTNLVFATRSAAGYAAYPFLPEVPAT
jgi:hypothetical protein